MRSRLGSRNSTLLFSPVLLLLLVVFLIALPFVIAPEPWETPAGPQEDYTQTYDSAHAQEWLGSTNNWNDPNFMERAAQMGYFDQPEFKVKAEEFLSAKDSFSITETQVAQEYVKRADFSTGNQVKIGDIYFSKNSKENVGNSKEAAGKYFTKKYSKDYSFEQLSDDFNFDVEKGMVTNHGKTVTLTQYQDQDNIIGIKVVGDGIIILEKERNREVSIAGDGNAAVSYDAGLGTYQVGESTIGPLRGKDGKEDKPYSGNIQVGVSADGSYQVTGPAAGKVKVNNEWITFVNRRGNLNVQTNGDFSAHNAEIVARNYFFDGAGEKKGNEVSLWSHGDTYSGNIRSTNSIFIDRATDVGVVSQGQSGEASGERREAVQIHLDAYSASSKHAPGQASAGPQSEQPAEQPSEASAEQLRQQARNLKKSQGDIGNNGEVWLKRTEKNEVVVATKGKVEVGFYNDRTLMASSPLFIGKNGGSELDLKQNGQTDVDIRGQVVYTDKYYGSPKLTEQGDLKTEGGINTHQNGASLSIIRKDGSDNDLLVTTCFDCIAGKAISLGKNLVTAQRASGRLSNKMFDSIDSTSFNVEMVMGEHGLEYAGSTADLGKLAEAQGRDKAVVLGKNLNLLILPIPGSEGTREQYLRLVKPQGDASLTAYMETTENGEVTSKSNTDLGVRSVVGDALVITSDKNYESAQRLMELLEEGKANKLSEAGLEFKPDRELRKMLLKETRIDIDLLGNSEYANHIEKAAQKQQEFVELRDQLKEKYGVELDDNGVCTAPPDCNNKINKAKARGGQLAFWYFDARKKVLESESGELSAIRMSEGKDGKNTLSEKEKENKKETRRLNAARNSMSTILKQRRDKTDEYERARILSMGPDNQMFPEDKLKYQEYAAQDALLKEYEMGRITALGSDNQMSYEDYLKYQEYRSEQQEQAREWAIRDGLPPEIAAFVDLSGGLAPQEAQEMGIAAEEAENVGWEVKETEKALAGIKRERERLTGEEKKKQVEERLAHLEAEKQKISQILSGDSDSESDLRMEVNAAIQLGKSVKPLGIDYSKEEEDSAREELEQLNDFKHPSLYRFVKSQDGELVDQEGEREFRIQESERTQKELEQRLQSLKQDSGMISTAFLADRPDFAAELSIKSGETDFARDIAQEIIAPIDPARANLVMAQFYVAEDNAEQALAYGLEAGRQARESGREDLAKQADHVGLSYAIAKAEEDAKEFDRENQRLLAERRGEVYFTGDSKWIGNFGQGVMDVLTASGAYTTQAATALVTEAELGDQNYLDLRKQSAARADRNRAVEVARRWAILGALREAQRVGKTPEEAFTKLSQDSEIRDDLTFYALKKKTLTGKIDAETEAGLELQTAQRKIDANYGKISTAEDDLRRIHAKYAGTTAADSARSRLAELDKLGPTGLNVRFIEEYGDIAIESAGIENIVPIGVAASIIGKGVKGTAWGLKAAEALAAGGKYVKTSKVMQKVVKGTEFVKGAASYALEPIKLMERQLGFTERILTDGVDVAKVAIKSAEETKAVAEAAGDLAKAAEASAEIRKFGQALEEANVALEAHKASRFGALKKEMVLLGSKEEKAAAKAFNSALKNYHAEAKLSGNAVDLAQSPTGRKFIAASKHLEEIREGKVLADATIEQMRQRSQAHAAAVESDLAKLDDIGVKMTTKESAGGKVLEFKIPPGKEKAAEPVLERVKNLFKTADVPEAEVINLAEWKAAREAALAEKASTRGKSVVSELAAQRKSGKAIIAGEETAEGFLPLVDGDAALKAVKNPQPLAASSTTEKAARAIEVADNEVGLAQVFDRGVTGELSTDLEKLKARLSSASDALKAVPESLAIKPEIKLSPCSVAAVVGMAGADDCIRASVIRMAGNTKMVSDFERRGGYWVKITDLSPAAEGKKVSDLGMLVDLELAAAKRSGAAGEAARLTDISPQLDELITNGLKSDPREVRRIIDPALMPDDFAKKYPKAVGYTPKDVVKTERGLTDFRATKAASGQPSPAEIDGLAEKLVNPKELDYVADNLGTANLGKQRVIPEGGKLSDTEKAQKVYDTMRSNFKEVVSGLSGKVKTKGGTSSIWISERRMKQAETIFDNEAQLIQKALLDGSITPEQAQIFNDELMKGLQKSIIHDGVLVEKEGNVIRLGAGVNRVRESNGLDHILGNQLRSMQVMDAYGDKLTALQRLEVLEAQRYHDLAKGSLFDNLGNMVDISKYGDHSGSHVKTAYKYLELDKEYLVKKYGEAGYERMVKIVSRHDEEVVRGIGSSGDSILDIQLQAMTIADNMAGTSVMGKNGLMQDKIVEAVNSIPGNQELMSRAMHLYEGAAPVEKLASKTKSQYLKIMEDWKAGKITTDDAFTKVRILVHETDDVAREASSLTNSLAKGSLTEAQINQLIERAYTEKAIAGLKQQFIKNVDSALARGEISSETAEMMVQAFKDDFGPNAAKFLRRTQTIGEFKVTSVKDGVIVADLKYADAADEIEAVHEGMKMDSLISVTKPYMDRMGLIGPNGEKIAVEIRNGKITIIDPSDGKLLQEIRPTTKKLSKEIKELLANKGELEGYRVDYIEAFESSGTLGKPAKNPNKVAMRINVLEERSAAVEAQTAYAKAAKENGEFVKQIKDAESTAKKFTDEILDGTLDLNNADNVEELSSRLKQLKITTPITPDTFTGLSKEEAAKKIQSITDEFIGGKWENYFGVDELKPVDAGVNTLTMAAGASAVVVPPIFGVATELKSSKKVEEALKKATETLDTSHKAHTGEKVAEVGEEEESEETNVINEPAAEASMGE